MKTKQLCVSLLMCGIIAFVLMTFSLVKRLKLPRHFRSSGSVSSFYPQKKVSIPRDTTPGCYPFNLTVQRSVGASSKGVPLLVHWLYRDTKIPEEYIRLLQKCQKINPEFTFVLWTNGDASKLLNSHYAKSSGILKKYAFELERSDVIRLFVLYHFGGMYMDMDMECKKPLIELLNSYPCGLDREREEQTQIYHRRELTAMNSAIFCQRKHPFIKSAIDGLDESRSKHSGVLEKTGPFYINDMHTRYSKDPKNVDKPVTILPSSVFSPLLDMKHKVIESMKEKCKSPDRSKFHWLDFGCKTMEARNFDEGDLTARTKNSYLVHAYLHLGHEGGHGSVKKFIDICNYVFRLYQLAL